MLISNFSLIMEQNHLLKTQILVRKTKNLRF